MTIAASCLGRREVAVVHNCENCSRRGSAGQPRELVTVLRLQVEQVGVSAFVIDDNVACERSRTGRQPVRLMFTSNESVHRSCSTVGQVFRLSSGTVAALSQIAVIETCHSGMSFAVVAGRSDLEVHSMCQRIAAPLACRPSMMDRSA